MRDFVGIFDYKDQHHFLAFDSSFNDILQILGDFFRDNVDSRIRIQDFRD